MSSSASKEEIKAGVVLLCRYTSSRLPGKIMMEVDGKPMIQIIVERISHVVPVSSICVATSEDPTDDIIQEWCKSRGITCFRGSLDNVSMRFMNAFSMMGWDYAARINGDNLFVEMNALKRLLDIAKENRYDFLCNTHKKTYPQGMSVEVVRTDFYKQSYSSFQSPEDFEHVTYYFHHQDAGEAYYLYNEDCPEIAKVKFAVDEKKDLDLCKLIYSNFTSSHLSYTVCEIASIYNSLKKEGEIQ